MIGGVTAVAKVTKKVVTKVGGDLDTPDASSWETSQTDVDGEMDFNPHTDAGGTTKQYEQGLFNNEEMTTVGMPVDLNSPDLKHIVDVYEEAGVPQQYIEEQLASFANMPSVETLGVDDVLVKVVPKGEGVSDFTPYFQKIEDVNGQTPDDLAAQLGLPPGSNVNDYDIYVMTPKELSLIHI